ncbi:MAG: YcxB family protein [Eubacterium sp.]|nr:YcxB family protein [Eubacterium sp.]
MSREQITLNYQLTKDEAYEAFYLHASRRSRTVKLIVSAVLTALAVILLGFYALDSRRIHMLFLAVCAIALLFYILYQPVLQAKRGARLVEKAGGKYRIILHRDGRIVLPDGGVLNMSGDKYARAVETDTIFALRPDAQHTICIPKRILSEDEAEFIRALL